MIALNRSMPKSCLECPCMQTHSIDDDYRPEVIHLMRLCAAEGKQMVHVKWYPESKHLPDNWINWERPEWCPWREV